jgi:hypothetical protein
MVQTAQYTLNLGRLIANGAKLPEWKAGDAFAVPRNKWVALSGARTIETIRDYLSDCRL